MLETYEGYVEEGRFYPTGATPDLKGRCWVLVTILDRSAPGQGETARRLEALDRFFMGIEASDEQIPEFARVKLREVEV